MFSSSPRHPRRRAAALRLTLCALVAACGPDSGAFLPDAPPPVPDARHVVVPDAPPPKPDAPVRLDAALPDAPPPMLDAAPIDATPPDACIPNPAGELCNGQDDNCNGQVDEGFPGVGNECDVGLGICARTGHTVCTPDGKGTECNVLPGPPGVELCGNGLDDNCDGHVDEGFPTLGMPCTLGTGACVATGHFVCSPDKLGVVCDAVPGTPGPVELCGDSIDNNCNGMTDEGFPNFGMTCAAGTGACQRGGQFVCTTDKLATTCNAVAGAPSTEVCNGLDDNCDGVADNGDPGGGSMCSTGLVGVCSAGTFHCTGGSLKCMQNVAAGTETCNGLDDDCNGVIDVDAFPDKGSACSAGVGACLSAGTKVCKADGTGTVCNAVAGTPTTEVCNGLDDNCDGVADNGDPGGGGACTSSGLGVCAPGTFHCTGGALKCQSNVSPSAEKCNGLDDNCDGTVDESFPDKGAVCSAGVGECARAGVKVCKADGTGTTCDAVPGTPTAEVCNGKDDNCNGQADEGDPGGGGACTTSGLGLCQPGTFHCVGGAIQCVPNLGPTTEKCNGLDDNCDGNVDESFPDKGSACTSGLGACLRSGVKVCDGTGAGTVCNATPGTPTTELCNGIDDDCNGVVDVDAFPNKGQSCTVGVGACARTGTFVCNGAGTATQCNVTAGAPGVEFCGDGVDSDCNGVDPTCPTNDFPSGAINITAGGTFTADLTFAHDDDSGSCGGSGGRDVFYTFTLPATEVVYADTFGSSFDSVVRIKSGACTASPTEVVCKDDACATAQTQLAVQLTAGTYCLVIDQFSSSQTTGSSVLHFVRGGRSGIAVTGAATLTGDTSAAGSTNQSAPTSCGLSGATGGDQSPDVGYFFTECSGSHTVTAATCGANTHFDTVLYLRQGNAGSSDLACGDDNCSNGGDSACALGVQTRASSVTTTVTGANLYWVIVDGFDSGVNCDFVGQYSVAITP